MADFNIYPALQGQSPDVLGQYLRGAQGAQGLQAGQMGLAAQAQRMQYLPEQLQQESEARGLNLEQLRMSLGWTGMINELAGRELTGETGGQGAPSMGRTGGIQNGPQDAVGGSAAGPGTPPAPGSTYGGGSYSGDGIAPSAATQGIAQGLGVPFSADLQRLMALKEGKYGPDTESAIFKDQMERRKLAIAPGVAQAQDVIESRDPGLMINRNPSYRAMWQQAGFTEDPARLDPNEVRQRVSTIRDQMLASSGQAPQGMPTTYQNTPGVGGLGYQTVASGKDVGKVSTFGDQKLPGYTLQPSYDAGTGHTKVTPLMTQPGGPAPPASLFGGRGGAALSYPPGPAGPAAAPARAPTAGGGVGSPAGQSFDVGYKEPPTPVQADTARRAQDFASGWQAVGGLEAKGVGLSTAQRVSLTQSIVGAGGIFGAHEALQKFFLQARLSPQQQQYVTSLLPMVAARSYEEGGRFNEQKFRESMEAMVPASGASADDLAQVNQFRANTQKSLDVGAGAAGGAPGLSDIAARRAAGTATTPAAAANLPTFTPAQAKAAGSGVRFRSIDGRIMVTH